MASHKNDFLEWVEKQNVEVFSKLSEVTTEFKEDIVAGRTCTFKNDYGVVFPGKTIMGFCKPTSRERCVYLDYDCYWLPAKLSNIILDK